ncbi:DUF1674 domain-containing protein [uncultured Gammaproteobacteria bacterium]
MTNPVASTTEIAENSVTGQDATTTESPGAKIVRQKPGEMGGPTGPEPTRFGDWEFKGRCSDF